ncbi:hypothetical protein D9M68_574680 [compost metagenome]
MHGGAALVGDSAGQQQIQAVPVDSTAAGHAGDQPYVLLECLDVEPHPVAQRQHPPQRAGLDAGAVQADLETTGTNLAHGLRQGWLQGGLAATEHHCLQQSLPLLEEGQGLPPAHGRLRPTADQFGIVTITAVPGAALAEQHTGQVIRIVEGSHRQQPADPQRAFAAGGTDGILAIGVHDGLRKREGPPGIPGRPSRGNDRTV